MGKAKETLGDATDDDSLRLRGKTDQVQGEAKQAAGKTGEAVRDVTDQAKGKIKKHK